MRRRQARRCTAQRTRGRGPCRAYAMNGQSVCSAHGGLAPQSRAAADRRLLESWADKEMARQVDAAARRRREQERARAAATRRALGLSNSDPRAYDWLTQGLAGTLGGGPDG